jgi:hypothetical protein
MANNKILTWLIVCGTAAALAAASSCKTGTGGGGGGSASSNGGLALDRSKAVEEEISARDGGWVAFASGDRESGVYFPAGSLAKDTVIRLTPLAAAPAGATDVLDSGFLVEEKSTGESPRLAGTAVVAFGLKDASPDAVVVKYVSGGDGYEVLPGRLISDRGVNVLMAGVSGLSPYGVKKGSAKDKKKAQESKEITFHNRISVDADAPAPYKVTSELGDWVFHSHLKLEVECADSIGWGGIYRGTSSFTIKGEFKKSAKIPFAVNMPLSFTASGKAAVAFMLPPKNPGPPPKPAPLVPQQKIVKLDPKLAGEGYMEFEQKDADLLASAASKEASLRREFKSSDGNRVWPFKAYIIPGAEQVLVDTAFGFYMGSATGTMNK